MYKQSLAPWAQDALESVRRIGTRGMDAVANNPKFRQLAAAVDNPKLKELLVNSLIGAGTGASALGLVRAVTPQDEDEPRLKGIIEQALLGAVLGGTSGAAYTGAREFMKEPPPQPRPEPQGHQHITRPIGDVIDSGLDYAGNHLGGVAGAGIVGLSRAAGAHRRIAGGMGTRPLFQSKQVNALAHLGSRTPIPGVRDVGQHARAALRKYERDINKMRSAGGALVDRSRLGKTMQRTLPLSKAHRNLQHAVDKRTTLQAAVKGQRVGGSIPLTVMLMALGALTGNKVTDYVVNRKPGGT
jgi:hypothetical protein